MWNVGVAVVWAVGLAGQGAEASARTAGVEVGQDAGRPQDLPKRVDRGELPEGRQVGEAEAAGPRLRILEYGVVPKPVSRQELLVMPAVQKALKLTETQKRAIGEEVGREANRLRDLPRGDDGGAEPGARQAVLAETTAALRTLLEPAQRERLDQIRLRAHGPLAFNPELYPEAAADPTDLTEPLALIDEQVAAVRVLARDGLAAIDAAATFPVEVDPAAGKPTVESVRALVAAPKYRAAKQKARDAAKAAWASTIERIEWVLAEPQRDAYRARLGAPFDLATLDHPGDDLAVDVALVARGLNVAPAVAQQSDPDFDATVAAPGYAKDEHPRVVIDEAHHNFHTASGRYKPLADLLTSDGYKVARGREPFTKDALAKADVLVIANALGAEGMRHPGAADPAFTDAECDAVRDWVRNGGALLLVTDLPPFGAAAAAMAERFGVETSRGFVTDPDHSEGDASNLVFTRGDDLLGDHPILNGRDVGERVERIKMFTGQSLQGPAGSVALLKLGDGALDRGVAGAAPVPAAGRSQGVAFRFGKGRVVVLGEAGGLSAQLGANGPFGMNVPGWDNRRFALNILHWLSGLL